MLTAAELVARPVPSTVSFRVRLEPQFSFRPVSILLKEQFIFLWALSLWERAGHRSWGPDPSLQMKKILKSWSSGVIPLKPSSPLTNLGFRVGKKGDVGSVEISDMLFTVKGATAGAILMEWNIHESTQGSGNYPPSPKSCYSSREYTSFFSPFSHQKI